MVAAFREHNDGVYQAGVYANGYALLLMPLTNVLGNFFVIVLAGLGGWLALRFGECGHYHYLYYHLRTKFHQPLRMLANMAC